MEAQEVKKAYLQAPRLPPPTRTQVLTLGLAGLVLSPLYWMLACCRDVPGLAFRAQCFRLGLRLLPKLHGRIDAKTVFFLLCYPMDSTRYFEFDFAWRALAVPLSEKYLDVSSPRFFFTLLLLRHKNLTADLLNPDKADLLETDRLLGATGLRPRCRLHDTIIANTPLASASFDVITSLSVVEHIPEDRQAIQKMWELLKPGGRLLLTVPCAARTSEQYIDHDEYGVLGAGVDGYVFWQRFYDEALLRERIFSVTGEPCHARIFGERTAGLFRKNSDRKWTERYYPFWREPCMVGEEYTCFDSLNNLPGEGVIAMEFIKP